MYSWSREMTRLFIDAIIYDINSTQASYIYVVTQFPNKPIDVIS